MTQLKRILITSILPCFITLGCSPSHVSSWILVDDFETDIELKDWTHIDVQNETNPFVPDPQIAEVHLDDKTGNHYFFKKPAADGIIGNRKALGLKSLPQDIAVGETYTVYTRINVEYFPNNHSFGLSNLTAKGIGEKSYDAFEPMIRITDKAESDGSRNDGSLTVLSGYKKYSKIQNPDTGKAAKPLAPNTWYELWYVVNNAPAESGGQTYDLYVRGGEFNSQRRVFSDAVFRMKREAPLKYFITISNTGSAKNPYGNGGVRYDDIYMAVGENLSSPLNSGLKN